MTNEILIALGGLVLSGLTYFAGVYRTKKQFEENDRSLRIDRVVAEYMGFVKISRTSGHDGLVRAGVATLKSDAEIREAIDRITKHGQNSPIAGEAGKLDGVDLHRFYSMAVERRHNFFRDNFDKLVEDVKGSNERAV